LLLKQCSLFITHISTPSPNGPSFSYMMFPYSCNTLHSNVGSIMLIHACFCHVLFICHKRKKVAMLWPYSPTRKKMHVTWNLVNLYLINPNACYIHWGKWHIE
jgi:hypothetical protein